MKPRLLKFKSKKFKYSGNLDDSKSIVNRLLIIQSHYKNLKFDFRSDADDVLFLQQSLFKFDLGKYEFDIGSGGTSLRFFLGRLSRTPGRYTVKASARLLSRPQDDLYAALAQLGTLVLKKDDETLHVVVNGWQETKTVYVKSDLSSQFISAILLNCWNLEQSLTIQFGPSIASESFLQLTKNVCQQVGMRFDSGSDQIVVESKQTVRVSKLKSEVDASSVFTLSCFALLFGHMKIKPCKNEFGQPDFQFLKFFADWKLEYKQKPDWLEISKQELPKFIELNIQNCPDLFPMLCALLSFSEGMHKIYGAPHLVNKESDRIAKTHELLELAGVGVTRLDDGLIVQGMASHAIKKFKFDPDKDHRMAFAAALFAFAGFEVELTDRYVVNKSFPQFWDVLGLIDV